MCFGKQNSGVSSFDESFVVWLSPLRGRNLAASMLENSWRIEVGLNLQVRRTIDIYGVFYQQYCDSSGPSIFRWLGKEPTSKFKSLGCWEKHLISGCCLSSSRLGWNPEFSQVQQMVCIHAYVKICCFTSPNGTTMEAVHIIMKPSFSISSSSVVSSLSGSMLGFLGGCRKKAIPIHAPCTISLNSQRMTSRGPPLIQTQRGVHGQSRVDSKENSNTWIFFRNPNPINNILFDYSWWFRNPIHNHLTCMKPCEQRDIYHISWCRTVPSTVQWSWKAHNIVFSH